MKPRLLFLKLLALVACLSSALGTSAAEAYACYTSSNATLTFYYDNQRSSRTGTTYDLNTDDNDTGWDTDGTNANVTKVVFNSSFASARPTTTCDWFYGMTNLQSITGMEYLNTSEVTNMNWMFLKCSKLTSVDVSHFNTSKVTSMYSMFNSCTGLTSLDLSSFNTSKVAVMLKMFYNSTNLRTIYVGNGWSTAAVTGSTEMFNYCTSLVGGQGTTWNDSNPKDKTYAHIDGGPSNPGYFTRIEAYACYTSSNATLTFYYDSQRSSRTGTTYDLNTGANITGWESDGTNASVTKVVFDPSFAGARPTTTYDWFYDMTNLQSITGMSYLNTSEVTNMAYMFMWCTSLTSLDVSHFNTSKVKHMRAMFAYCTGLTSLDLSSFNTANVTDMRAMFYNSTNLRTIYVGNDWSTAAVTYSDDMFWNCTSLVGGKGTTYDENHIDGAYAHIDGGTSNPGYFTEILPEAYACYTPSNTTLTFYYDSRRSSRTGTTYDLNTGGDTPAWRSDGTYENVTTVVFDPSFAGARPTTTARWFMMTKLQTITGIGYLNTSNVTSMYRMFYGCSGLTSLDVSNFNTSNVTDMGGMFNGCSGLTSLDLSNFNTSNVTNMGEMFNGCSGLTSLDLSNFNTSKVTSMDRMFYGCSGLTSLDVSNFNTSYVTSMGWMFDGCSGLTNLDLGNFNTSNVTSMVAMFLSCRGLTSLDLSNFNTSKVTSMDWMFYGCSGLTSLDVSNFNTSYVTSMGWMFAGCSSLTSLNLSNWNTAMVTNMQNMFNGCSGLTSLDLSNWNTAMVTNMQNMFKACSGLTTIYVGDEWSTDAVTQSTSMFYGCTSLVGGMGTTYNASHIDKAYAHIDGGTSNPGYFTDPNAVAPSVRGDVDGDGAVNIDDVTTLIDYLLGGTASGINLQGADCDQSGTVNIDDVTTLIDYLLGGAWN